MGNWIYHGHDRLQCLYQASCIICYIKKEVGLLQLWARLRRADG